MPQRVTWGLLKREQVEDKPLYHTEEGLEYEIAPGQVVTLKSPVRSLSKKFYAEVDRVQKEKIKESDVLLAKMVTVGAWPESNDDLITPVISVIVADFSDASLAITRPGTQSSSQSNQLLETLAVLISRLGPASGSTDEISTLLTKSDGPIL